MFSRRSKLVIWRLRQICLERKAPPPRPHLQRTLPRKIGARSARDLCGHRRLHLALAFPSGEGGPLAVDEESIIPAFSADTVAALRYLQGSPFGRAPALAGERAGLPPKRQTVDFASTAECRRFGKAENSKDRAEISENEALSVSLRYGAKHPSPTDP